MSVDGLALLADLRAQGLRLSTSVDNRLLVSPRGAVTTALDERIRAGRHELLKALDVERRQREELQQRIREMAARWRYSADELADAMAASEQDPAAWRELCDRDEAGARLCERTGARYPP